MRSHGGARKSQGGARCGARGWPGESGAEPGITREGARNGARKGANKRPGGPRRGLEGAKKRHGGAWREPRTSQG